MRGRGQQDRGRRGRRVQQEDSERELFQSIILVAIIFLFGGVGDILSLLLLVIRYSATLGTRSLANNSTRNVPIFEIFSEIESQN